MNPAQPIPQSPPSKPDFARSAAKEAPVPPRKTGSLKRKFYALLFFAALGGGAYVYYNPAAVLPDFLVPILIGEKAGESAEESEPKMIRLVPLPGSRPVKPAQLPGLSAPAQETETPSPSKPTPVRETEVGVTIAIPPKPTPLRRTERFTADADDDSRLALVSNELAAMRAQFARMRTQMEQALRRAGPSDTANTRLWLVGLILESNGDTQAAAESLLRIVNAPSSQTPDPVAPELAQQARDEARRLSQAPKRSVILDEIIALRDALESSNLSPDSETSDSLIGGLASFLRGAFSVSRRDADGESAMEQMRTHAARMEFYLASNNRRLYLRALDETARLWAELESVGGDPAVGARVSRLRELGAPDYRLNLPLSKP